MTESDPYRDPSESADAGAAPSSPQDSGAPPLPNGGAESAGQHVESAPPPRLDGGSPPAQQGQPGQQNGQGQHSSREQFNSNQRDQSGGSRRGRRNRRGRQRTGGSGQGGQGGQAIEQQQSGPPPVIVPDTTTEGWFDPSRDGGFIRRHVNSYLADMGDAYIGSHLIRAHGLRRGDKIVASAGHDHRGRLTVAEITTINDDDPTLALRRPDFSSLTASYPERHLILETGRPAKGGPEVTRRAIDLIAPIGYGQRALIVAPARAGKTMLLQAITEGVAINHPNAVLLILLVDERPEEVSEAISWGVGEVIASSFDQPAKRHVEVVEMVLERARRQVEQGKDVVIVLDSLAHGTRLQYGRTRHRPHALRRTRLECDGETKSVLRFGPGDSA